MAERAELSRRAAVRTVLGGFAATLLAACQSPSISGPMAAPTATNPLIKPRASGAELTAVQASSELALGRDRFAVGLIDAQNQPVTNGTARLEFFKLMPGGSAEKRADAEAVFRAVAGATARGIWVAQTSFGEAGTWGAQITLQRPGEAPKVARLNFEVRQKFSAPGYGDPAPRSRSLTERDVGGDPSHICSNTPPCALHAVSIADALDQAQKPLVVVFATPALCTSQLCAPELDAVVQLHEAYADRATFVHVEIYEYPFDGQRVAKTVSEWSLPGEPFTFVVDRGGLVRDRFEGAAPTEEVEPALKAVLA